MTNAQAIIDAFRAEMHEKIDTSCAALSAALSGDVPPNTSREIEYRQPTLADGHDDRNKNGLNLTPRGIEILYRVFDDDGGYNRAAKMLNISQGAAKNRKALWQREGGKDRIKKIIDIDAM